MKLLLPFWLLTQSALPTGVVIREVVCSHQPEQSYALYLPSGYTPDRSWPILYAFEPAARGWLPVERFQAAAEEFGYIVAASNNSRNGSWPDSIAAADAVWGDTRARFSIDDKRVYATGFSGGARVATGVGVMTDALAGVVVVGGGLPSQVQAGEVRFPVLAVAGTTDMNLLEAWQLSRTLRDKKRSAELIVFEGGHQWLPQAEARRALEWLELEAMRSARRPLDRVWIETTWQRRTAAARQLSGGPAWEAWRRLAEEFDGLRDTAEAAAGVEALSRDGSVRQWLERRRDLFREEENLRFGLEQAYREVGTPMEKSLRWWQRRTAQIRDRQQGAARDEDHMLARVIEAAWRAHLEAFAFAPEAATDLAHARVASTIAPDSAWLTYNLARSLARSGKADEALATLGRAVDQGFANLPRLEGEAAFDPLRDHPEFQALQRHVAANG